MPRVLMYWVRFLWELHKLWRYWKLLPKDVGPLFGPEPHLKVGL